MSRLASWHEAGHHQAVCASTALQVAQNVPEAASSVGEHCQIDGLPSRVFLDVPMENGLGWVGLVHGVQGGRLVETPTVGV